MAAPAKFLFDTDFAAPDKTRERAATAAEIAQKVAEAEARAYRAGYEAAQHEARVESDRRAALALEEENRESAERIKALMFTFDDLIKLDSGSAQTLMRTIDKSKLGIALKSANEEVRAFFLGNMSSRAGKMLIDDMGAMGPVRLRDVDEAQALLVNLAKDLAAKGEITLTKNRADDELVY